MGYNYRKPTKAIQYIMGKRPNLSEAEQFARDMKVAEMLERYKGPLGQSLRDGTFHEVFCSLRDGLPIRFGIINNDLQVFLNRIRLR